MKKEGWGVVVVCMMVCLRAMPRRGGVVTGGRLG